MTANTGLALLLLGGAGVLRDREDAGAVRKTLSLLAALVVLAIGLATIAEHAFGIDLHIDQIIARSTDPVPHPGRPAPATALALACLAGALLRVRLPRPRPRAPVRMADPGRRAHRADRAAGIRVRRGAAGIA